MLYARVGPAGGPNCGQESAALPLPTSTAKPLSAFRPDSHRAVFPAGLTARERNGPPPTTRKPLFLFLLFQLFLLLRAAHRDHDASLRATCPAVPTPMGCSQYTPPDPRPQIRPGERRRGEATRSAFWMLRDLNRVASPLPNPKIPAVVADQRGLP
ncbi:MAG: hypothetical protein HC875_12200, partial [Anaerolineales bacterium]|nr:hypothetical protein [Anaerolineales bacterium]